MAMKPSDDVTIKFAQAIPAILDSPSVKTMVVAGITLRAMKGDVNAFYAVKELIDDVEKDSVTTTQGAKVDFDTFCYNAGYFKPFPQQKEFVDFAFSGATKLVLASRKYGKTDYITICGAAYEIYKNTKRTFLIISKTRDKAASIVSEIGNVLKANGTELAIDSTRRIKIKGVIGKQENAKAWSVRMSPKMNHVDFVICDDIVDIKDQYSQKEREYIENYYDAMSGMSENIIILGQPVHAKDLYSKIAPLVKVMMLPYGSIPELDKAINLEAKRAAGISETFIQKNYFLKVDESETCPFAGIETVDFYPSEGSFMWIDGADTGEDDTTIACYSANFENLICVGFSFRRAWYECEDAIKAIWQMFAAKKGGFEINKFGRQPIIILRKENLDFVGVNTTVNKKAKIQNAATFKKNIKLSTKVSNGSASLIEANKRFNKQVKEYEYIMKHDDAPDNIASAMLHLGLIKME
ncbi:MAG: hypothetical protein LBD46_06650 [Endomicrobium sp.]|jgi:hypothetical protein|nr:hypothetical protein [Endomicrobium sp.]